MVVATLEKRSPCDCYEGVLLLKSWHEVECEHCCFGWVVVVPDPMRSWERYSQPCTDCKEGKNLAALIAGEKATRLQTLLNNLVAGAGLTPELASKTFDNFETDPGMFDAGEADQVLGAFAAVKAAAQEGKSLVLLGNTGTGKSHLAAAYLNYCLTVGRTGVFVSLIDLMGSLYETFDRESKISWQTALKRYVEADVLVIDDLGQEKATEKTIEVVFHLLNHRINNCKTTVVTSNRSLASLRDDKGYSHAIISRLGSFQRVSWEVKDWRLK